MDDRLNETLERAIEAARLLPDDVQEELGRELLERVDGYSTPKRSPERQQIIKDRLARPLVAAPKERIDALLRKFDADQ